MTALNAATLPLQGRHLIEASAGTGKTFTVANLYLRLLIDAHHATPPAVENILVVTFTNAATEELRARLRSRIAVALQVLDGHTPDDADATYLQCLNHTAVNLQLKTDWNLPIKAWIRHLSLPFTVFATVCCVSRHLKVVSYLMQSCRLMSMR